MEKERKINELINILINIRPEFQRSVGKNRLCEALKSNIKLATNQQTCMNIIHNNEGISMSCLASKLGVSNQQITRIVTDLEEYNFVERKKDQNNRRMILVYETENGKKYYQDLFDAMNNTAKKIFNEIDEDILDQILFHLKEIMKILGQIG